MVLTTQNTLWEFLVNYPNVKDLKKVLKSMSFSEIDQFCIDCDKLGSDIINGKNEMFDKQAVSVIIQVRKLAVKKLGKQLSTFLS